MLRLTKKIFEDKELLHELFLTTRQKIKIGNLIANNMPRDLVKIKNQIFKKECNGIINNGKLSLSES